MILFFCIYLLPYEIHFFGTSIPFPEWIKGIVGLSFPVTVNVSEVVRGGIQSLPTGQWEAVDSLGLTRGQSLKLCIIPQAVKRMTAPWMNTYPRFSRCRRGAKHEMLNWLRFYNGHRLHSMQVFKSATDMNQTVPYASILPILLIALSSNLDNIGVGVSYGVRKINIPFASNFLIAVVTATGTFLSIFLGQSVYLFISKGMDGLLGGGIIIVAGLWVVFQDKCMHRVLEPREAELTGPSRYGLRHIAQILDNPIVADWDFSGHIDMKEALALAFGLTINNIPNGVGAGILGLNIFAMTAIVFVASIVTIWLGIYLGKLGVRWVGRYASVLAGVLLIIVGLYEIFF